MKSKKGFTLIELLAVIAVIAIISSITLPNVLSFINNSKEKAAVESANNIVRGLDEYYFKSDLSGDMFNGYTCTFPSNCNEIKFNGKRPSEGSLVIDDDGNVNGTIVFNDYNVVVTNNEITDVYKGLKIGTEYAFDYTGSEQEFNVPKSGYYKLEVWGAQGGDYNTPSNGGYGGYSSGLINLTKTDVLYIVVGGHGLGGSDQVDGYGKYINGGYNGGGACGTWVDAKTCGSGGGATHIAKSSGLLSELSDKKNDVLIVAGGGGGSGLHVSDSYYGGSGGGIAGSNGYANGDNWYGTGGTQTTGGISIEGEIGIASGFGIGGYSYWVNSDGKKGNSSGGGAGWYGGGSGVGSGGFGGGGSGYIGNALLTNKSMYCYNCEESTDVDTKTISTTNVSETATSQYAKLGNGYAKITYIGSDIPVSTEFAFDYTGGEQEFNVPKSGYYKFEAWGAQGESNTGGKGAYTSGLINLTKNQVLYVFVGGQGNTFNGGGDSNSNSLNKGGGATDIRLVSGNWDDDASLRSRIMVAAGGGNVTSVVEGATAGVGGKTSGIDGTPHSVVPVEYAGKGANPSSGGAGGTSASAGTFGKGGSAGVYTDGHVGAGGGGGYYGGGGSTWHAGSGGGSSFISGYVGCVCITTGTSEYPGYVFINPIMKAGNESMPTHNGGSYMVGNSGNGFAKITYVGNN